MSALFFRNSTAAYDDTIARCIWIARQIDGGLRVHREVYMRRWGVSRRTWFRDVHRVRRAGLAFDMRDGALIPVKVAA